MEEKLLLSLLLPCSPLHLEKDFSFASHHGLEGGCHPPQYNSTGYRLGPFGGTGPLSACMGRDATLAETPEIRDQTKSILTLSSTSVLLPPNTP